MAIGFKREKGLPLFLDIGSNSIKWLQVKEGKELPEIAKLGVVKLPAGSLRDGFVTDNRAITQTLATLLEEHGLKEKSCVTALSGLQVVAKIAKLPPMAEEEVRQALQYQAENYIPYPADQVVMDIHMLGETSDGEARKVNALLVAAQKEAVYSTVEVVEEAGLRVQALEVGPFVSLRSIVEANPSTEEDHLLCVHIGASSSALSVVSEKTLRFCRIVPIAGNHLTKALVNTLRIEFSDAERTKKKMGAAFVNEEKEVRDLVLVKQLKNMMLQVLTGLLNEIQRSIAYYESKNRRSNIQKILLTGASVKLTGLPTFLEQELGIPVELPNPFSPFEVKADVSEAYLQSVAPLFPICTGLALRELEGKLPEGKLASIAVSDGFEFGSSRQAGI